MKKIFSVIFVLSAILLIIRIYSSNSNQNKNETRQSAEFIEYMPIDKLFTAFAYVPLLEFERGYLKRDRVLNYFKKDKAKEIIKGYCYRQYDIGIGYEHSDLFQKFQEAACQGRHEELPEPVILSINAVSSEVFGGYTRKDCDALDMEDSERRKSHQVILEQLKKDGQWNKIVKNSQKALASFIRVYCL